MDNCLVQRKRVEGHLAYHLIDAKRKIEVVFNRNYQTAIVFAPLFTDMVCIEPQTGPTNAFNLQHQGNIEGLTNLSPGKTFKASFQVIPKGY